MPDATDNKTLRSEAASRARWMSAATVIRIAAQMLQLFILGRILGTGDFGLMGMVLTVVVFGQAMADVGVSNAIMRYRNATRREPSSLYWLNVFGGLIIFAPVWFSIPLNVLPATGGRSSCAGFPTS